MRRGLRCTILVLVVATLGIVVGFRGGSPLVDKGYKSANLSDARFRTLDDILIMYGPPGDYSTRKQTYGFFKTSGEWPPPGHYHEWRDDHAIICAYYNSDSGALSYWGAAPALRVSVWDRIVHWLFGFR